MEPLFWIDDFPVERGVRLATAVGMGRSYGDVCLLEGGTLLCTRGLDRLLAL